MQSHRTKSVQIQWELSSAGSEHLPYKQRVDGSNPPAPTERERYDKSVVPVFLFAINWLPPYITSFSKLHIVHGAWRDSFPSLLYSFYQAVLRFSIDNLTNLTNYLMPSQPGRVWMAGVEWQFRQCAPAPLKKFRQVDWF